MQRRELRHRRGSEGLKSQRKWPSGEIISAYLGQFNLTREVALELHYWEVMASPAQTNPRIPPAWLDPSNPPSIEIDVADSRYTDPSFWLDQSPDICIGLEELYPHDPDEEPNEPSGAHLRFFDYDNLSAYIGTHCFGLLDGPDLLEFLRCSVAKQSSTGTDAVAEMCELDPRRPNGARILCDKRGLSVWFGNHCLGVVGGESAKEFLRRCWMRATADSDSDHRHSAIVSITDGFARYRRCSSTDDSGAWDESDA